MALGAEVGGDADAPGAGVLAVADGIVAGAEAAVLRCGVAAVGRDVALALVGQVDVDQFVDVGGGDNAVGGSVVTGAVAVGAEVAVAVEVLGVGAGIKIGGDVAVAAGAGQGGRVPGNGLIGACAGTIVRLGRTVAVDGVAVAVTGGAEVVGIGDMGAGIVDRCAGQRRVRHGDADGAAGLGGGGVAEGGAVDMAGCAGSYSITKLRICLDDFR